VNIVIDNTSEDPIYKQIYDQISAQIIRGELKSDFCLPPIRTVAKELRISVITIKKAWEELEHNGLIYTMVGKGCFVAPLPSARLADKRNEMVSQKMAKDVEYYRSLGLTEEEIVELMRKFYK
jgi:GntR family transcriptional regulator